MRLHARAELEGGRDVPPKLVLSQSYLPNLLEEIDREVCGRRLLLDGSRGSYTQPVGLEGRHIVVAIAGAS